MPDYPNTAYVTLAPSWVCKVLSISTRRVNPHESRPVYTREGVTHLWLIAPKTAPLRRSSFTMGSCYRSRAQRTMSR